MNASEAHFKSAPLSWGSEKDCIRTLFRLRWPNGFICPRCQSREAFEITTRRLPLYECRSCKKQTSLTAGTIMEGSRTPLLVWFSAIYLHSLPEGISATKLAAIVGVTYKTAWLIAHKIRHAMSLSESKALLTGVVHVVESVHCPRRLHPQQYKHQEQPIISASSYDEKRDISHIKIEKMPSDADPFWSAPAIMRHFIHRNVDCLAAENITVSFKREAYNRNRPLIRIAQEAEYWIARTFRGIGPKHLQAYFDQYCYGWNTMKSQDRFARLSSICALSPVLTYQLLTKVPNSKRSLRSARLSLGRLKKIM